MATPSPIRAIRNCTTTETSVASASGQSTRNVVGMAIAAISSGTSAISEPKTNASTMSAPSAAEEGLDQHARPAASSLVAARERVEAGDPHRRAVRR